MGDSDLDECVNCGAGLLSVRDICPQCGWPKNKPIEHVEVEETTENDIENDSSTIESTEIKKRVFRPAGVRMLGVFHMALGIFLIGFSILFASAVMLSVMTTAMGILAGIGSMGSMPMLPGLDSIDPATLSMISGMPGTGVMSIDEMMTIMGATAANASVVIILGIFAVIVGRGVLKGKKWAWSITRILVAIGIVFDIISQNIVGLIIDGVILYYLYRPIVKEYFGKSEQRL